MKTSKPRFGLLTKIILFLAAVLIPLAAVTWYISVQTLRRQMVAFIHEIRTLDLKKLPSVSETIDWARVLVLLQAGELEHEMVKDTLNVLLKYEADIEAALPQVSTFVAKAARQNVFG